MYFAPNFRSRAGAWFQPSRLTRPAGAQETEIASPLPGSSKKRLVSSTKSRESWLQAVRQAPQAVRLSLSVRTFVSPSSM